MVLRPLMMMVGMALAGLSSLVCPREAFAQASPLTQMTLEELSELEVVSVSRNPQPYGQAPAAILVITQDDIRRSGATSIPEALRLADNLMVAKKNAHDWAISARGFNTDLANKLLVLIDGRTVYTPLFSGVFWDRQDYLLEDVDRIEVISGPGGTLWGANAVNGVINIVTKSAEHSQGLYVEGVGGPHVTGLGGARYGAAIGSRLFVRVYGKYADRGSERLPDGREAADSWRLGQGGFRVDTDTSRRDAFTLQGDLHTGRQRVGMAGDLARVEGGNLLGRWSRTFSPDSGLRLQAYYDRTYLSLPVPAQVLGGIPLAPAGTLRDDLDTSDIDVQHWFPVAERHRVTWGAGYRFTHDEVSNAPALGFDPPVLDHHLASAFVQDEMALSPTVAITVGTKIEHNGYTGLEVEPSARVRWNPTSTHMFWGAISRAVRAPARVDRDERLGTPGLAPFVENLLVGGADFVSETLVAYEAGTRAQLGPLVSLSLSAFYNQYANLRSTSLSPPDPVLQLPFPLFFENNLEGTTFGTEVSANYQALEWWRVHVGYTFLSEDIRVAPGRADFNNALNETADPAHQFFLRSSMTLPRNVELDASLRRIADLPFNQAGTPDVVPGYGELDARLAWQPGQAVALSIAGQNLLHEQHLEYVIASPNPRGEIRRRVHGSMTFRW